MEEVDFLVDTNILIYLSQKQENIITFLSGLRGNIGISVLSNIEFMMGIDVMFEEYAKTFLDSFISIPLDKSIANRVQEVLKLRKSKNTKDPKFADIIIGATAEVNSIPLITNNRKDFEIFRGLEIVEV